MPSILTGAHLPNRFRHHSKRDPVHGLGAVEQDEATTTTTTKITRNFVTVIFGQIDNTLLGILILPLYEKYQSFNGDVGRMMSFSWANLNT